LSGAGRGRDQGVRSGPYVRPPLALRGRGRADSLGEPAPDGGMKLLQRHARTVHGTAGSGTRSRLTGRTSAAQRFARCLASATSGPYASATPILLRANASGFPNRRTSVRGRRSASSRPSYAMPFASTPPSITALAPGARSPVLTGNPRIA